MGEYDPSDKWLFQPTFNRSIKLRAADDCITSDAGALLLRQLDQQLGLTADLAESLVDTRNQNGIRYTQTELIRHYVYGLALGYAHQDDADRLAHDVAMKMAVWDRPGQQVRHERLASQPSAWRLIDRLSAPSQRHKIREALARCVGRHQQAANGGQKASSGTLDIDPFPIELHGQQQGVGYHGYYRRKMYYPLAASFSADGDYDGGCLGEGFVHAMLRRGRCGGAEGMARFTREAIRKSQPLAEQLDIRIDAGLVEGKVLDTIDNEGVYVVGRLKKNAILERLAQPYLTRSPGRPNKYGDETIVELGPYRAASWTRDYRLILVIVDLPDPKTGMRQLFPRHFFLITNWPTNQRDGWSLLEHYRKRGTFEDRLGEFNSTIGPGLCARSFASNEAVLLLKLFAFNVAGILRGELEASAVTGWDLRRVQQTVLKAGARITTSSRRMFVHVARGPSRLWGRVLGRMKRWWLDTTWSRNASGQRRSPPRPWVAPPAHAHLHLVLRE